VFVFDGFIKSNILFHKFVLMLQILLLPKVFVQVIGPFIIKFLGILVVASVIKSRSLTCNSLMNDS